MRRSTLACMGSVLLLIAGFLIGNLYAQSQQTKRETVYRQFGPKLIEAVVETMRDEINVLRVEKGLPARTEEQIVGAIQVKLQSLEDYQWMKAETLFPK